MSWYHVLKAVHLLSAVIWIGGMFFALIVLRPSLSVLEPAQRLTLNQAVFRRFFLVIWHAMPVQIVTGFIMVYAFYGGMGDLEPSINIMMSLGLLMAVIFLIIFFGPYRTFRAAPAPGPAELIRKLVGVNLVLGFCAILAAMLL